MALGPPSWPNTGPQYSEPMSGLSGAAGVVTPAEALDVVRDEFGLGFADHPRPRSVLVVDVTERTGDLDELGRLAGSLPCVLVGVADRAREAPKGFDVLFSTHSSARPWVRGNDPGAMAAHLGAKIEAAPLAAVALVQLLRLGDALSA